MASESPGTAVAVTLADLVTGAAWSSGSERETVEVSVPKLPVAIFTVAVTGSPARPVNGVAVRRLQVKVVGVAPTAQLQPSPWAAVKVSPLGSVPESTGSWLATPVSVGVRVRV